MQDREYGLIPNQSDPPRFIRVLSYEAINWVGADGTPSRLELVPVLKELERLDVSNPRALNYGGPEWRWVPVHVQQVGWHRPQWPNGVTSETEDTRRLRIRTIRQLIHVDPKKGHREPRWQLEVNRAQGQILRQDKSPAG
jgi:hypothetical protein